MPIPANTRYLLEQVGLDPDALTPQDVLIARARNLRDLLRRWWGELEPEHTAGVSIELLENALVEFATHSLRWPKQQLTRQWAEMRIGRKLGGIHGRAERVIAQRLLASASRLGMLAPGGRVAFAHPSFRELYAGLGHARDSSWPAELAKADLFSPKVLSQPWAGVTWARLAFTDGDDLDEAFEHVAAASLHLAVWYSYVDATARGRFGDDLAASLLDCADWEAGPPHQQMLDGLLASLGRCGVEAARERLSGEATLPALWLTACHLGRHGGAEDARQLAALAADPVLGDWEIERMREAIREAESLTLDPEVLRRYRREELVQYGKQAAAVLVAVVGVVALRQVVVDHRIFGTALDHSQEHAVRHSLQHAVQHGLQHGLQPGHGSGGTSASDVLAIQRTLRDNLAFLPEKIVRRKAQIEQSRPQVQQALVHAAREIDRREAEGRIPPLPR
jgi:hypothetical protein